jgi:pimeloyl-ACP methyl ester carboxylesterase
MAGYVQLGDVHSWYDELGEGEPVVLLHPRGPTRGPTRPTSGRSRRASASSLRSGGRAHAGYRGPITYELMAQDTITLLQTKVGGPAHLVGCSDGATVALLVALRRPDLARRIVLVACT